MSWVLERISKNLHAKCKRRQRGYPRIEHTVCGPGKSFLFDSLETDHMFSPGQCLGLPSCLTSCREIWACSSWMLLVAAGVSSISLWAPSISSCRCCISCSYCSYCTTASFERKKKDTWLSFYINNCGSFCTAVHSVKWYLSRRLGNKERTGKPLDVVSPQLYADISKPSI